LLSRIWLSETAAVNDTTIELLNPAPGERICEIGFGPGRTLGRLAAAGAEVVGIDVSAVMVAAAGRRNAGSVAAGRMRLYHGDGTTLPVADDGLDAVIGVHAIYFWPRRSSTPTYAWPSVTCPPPPWPTSTRHSPPRCRPRCR
jgi:arsenite methyltransferase